jgi:hypothetical protein
MGDARPFAVQHFPRRSLLKSSEPQRGARIHFHAEQGDIVYRFQSGCPMQTHEERDRIVFLFEPFAGLGPRWAVLLATLGSLGMGTYFIYDLLGQWQSDPPGLASVAAMAVIVFAFIAALAVVKEWRARRVEVDRLRKVITLGSPRLIGTARRQLTFADIADVGSVERPRSWLTFWGDASYVLRAELRSKEVVALSHPAQVQERPALEAAAETIKRTIA